MKTYFAAFSVDENKLYKEGNTFHSECGWLADSGIYLKKYFTIKTKNDRNCSNVRSNGEKSPKRKSLKDM